MSSRISVNKAFARNERGGVLVEAALATPLFILLVVGVLDLGIYLWQWNAANKATHLGARFAVVNDPVARGPGLTTSPLTEDLSVGESCSINNPCRVFTVTCTSIGCSGNEHQFDQAAFNRIFDRMVSIFPGLEPEDIEIQYSSNGLGFNGFPGNIPNDVTVSIIERDYDFVALGRLINFGPLRINAAHTLTSESLRTRS